MKSRKDEKKEDYTISTSASTCASPTTAVSSFDPSSIKASISLSRSSAVLGFFDARGAASPPRAFVRIGPAPLRLFIFYEFSKRDQ